MKQLNKSEIETINTDIEKSCGLASFFGKKDNVSLNESAGIKIVFQEQKPVFFYSETIIVPTLRFLLTKNILKKVVVDMGAVKFISSGADVMRPGIVEFDSSILKDSLVAVVDKNFQKPLAVGIVLFSAEEINSMKTGKIVKSVHYVGDEIWRIE